MEPKKKREITTPEGHPDDLLPQIPDGGYGWIIFLGTLFFQALIPSLIVSFGVILASSRIQIYSDPQGLLLWGDQLLYVPLFFTAAWTFFDSTTRRLICNSTWPRLVTTSGTCLTCAGMLFMWMGMLGHYPATTFFILSGIIGGIGASLQIAQCEIILAQYFKFKHNILRHVTQAVVALGFILAPIAVGHHLITSNRLHVTLWYQAIILQGLIVNMLFKKPQYLKRQAQQAYNVVTNVEEGKNIKELQVRRDTELPTQPSTSSWKGSNQTTLPSKTGTNWEQFEDSDDSCEEVVVTNTQNWVHFDSTGDVSLREELEEVPEPIYSPGTVNNNISYGFDYDDSTPGMDSGIFLPNSPKKTCLSSCLEHMKQPTFYKSLFTVITMKFSYFVFFALFPSFLYLRVETLKLRQMSTFVGLLSCSSLVYAFVSYWIYIERTRRAVSLWFLSWLGSLGYFLLTESDSEVAFLLGAILIVTSIAALQTLGTTLMGLTIRGETATEYWLISTLSGLSFTFFLLINVHFSTCFRFMAILHFTTGILWFSNHFYKRFCPRTT